MDINDILIFVKLAEIRNFAKTAEELYISPSTVTYSIKKIESELHTQLLQRNSHSVSLTEAGNTFYRDMDSLVHTWTLSKQHLQLSSKKSVPFHIGLISMTLQDDFSAIIAQFMKKNPEVQLYLDVCPVDDPTCPIRNGNLDVAFLYHDAIKSHSNIHFQFLASIPLYVVINKENPLADKPVITIDDLKYQTIFVFPASINNTLEALVRLGTQILTLGDEAPKTVTISDHKYCTSLVENNLGITFMPVFPPTKKASDKLVLRPFWHDDYQFQIGIAWQTEKYSVLTESLLNIATEYFKL